MSKILEIACFNLESAIIAEASGADRIEVCQNYVAGGLTPSEETILAIRKMIRIPVNVIIRPRDGNYVFTSEEVVEMKKSILFCKYNYINGLVFGCLTIENKIDLELCRELILLANPLPVTFHRAIDSCKDLTEEIQKAVDLGFKRVLTSGGKKKAADGKITLSELYLDFKNKIVIMPGGGIRSDTISEILKVTGCDEFHSAAITTDSDICDSTEIQKLKKIIHSYT